MSITRASFSTKPWYDRYVEARKTQASVRAAQTEQVLNSDRSKWPPEDLDASIKSTDDDIEGN